MPKLKLSKYDRMKLGKRAAYLRRCIRASELIEQYETDCTVRYRIFEKYIKQEVGHVSYTSFNRMLLVLNPQKQLGEILEILDKNHDNT